MRAIFDYIVTNWTAITIPVAVFIVSMIALFWLRKLALDRLTNWSKRINWSVGNTLIPSLKGTLSLLCLILSIYLAVAVANIPSNWKIPISNGLWSLFVAAITITLLNLASQATFFYGRKFKMPKRAISVTQNVVRVLILIVALLVVLAIWGRFATSPVLLLVAVIVLIAIIAFRDAAPNLFSSFQIAATQEIKIGDYIKLDTGEEGYVTEISWNKNSSRSSG